MIDFKSHKKVRKTINVHCMFGYHKWVYDPKYTIPNEERTCSRCGRHEHSHFNFLTSGPQWNVQRLKPSEDEIQ